MTMHRIDAAPAAAVARQHCKLTARPRHSIDSDWRRCRRYNNTLLLCLQCGLILSDCILLTTILLLLVDVIVLLLL